MAVDVLYQAARAFLDAAVDALNLTPAGAPARQYVSAGRPAMDCCGQVVAWCSALNREGAVGPGALAGAHEVMGGKPTLAISIQATRCDATIGRDGGRIELPEPAAMEAVAQIIDADGWALWKHLSAEIRAEDGVLSEVCSGAWRDGFVKLEPQGGCVGWELRYRWPVTGGSLGT